MRRQSPRRGERDAQYRPDAGGAPAVLAPRAFVDAARSLTAGTTPATGDPAAGPQEVTLTLSATEISVQVAGGRVVADPMEDEFPDYRTLVNLPAGRQATVRVTDLRAAASAGTRPRAVHGHAGELHNVVVLAVDAAGALQVITDEPADTDAYGPQVGVNPEFLLQALDAGGRDQLLLDLGGPIAPLAVRVPDDTRTFSILMPIRLA